MRTESILRHLGFIFLFQALFLLISLAFSVVLWENSIIPLLFTFLTASIFGTLFVLFTNKVEEISFIEGIAIVVLGWVTTCMIGAIPFFLWGGNFTVVNAWFESVSGFTTTGATILSDVESLPKGLLFFRSSTHFMGGIGIILFVLLVLPQSKSKFVLLNTEFSSLSQTNFRQNKQQVLQIIGYVYVGLTVAQIIALCLAGMNLFDSINHSFATIATGGFSTKNLSIAYYDSLTIEIIIMVFMVLGAVHFGLLYGTIIFSKTNLFTSSMARSFLLVMTIGVCLVALKLWQVDMYSIGDAFRYASFQVISLGTTTGFATVDTAHWPPFAILVILYFTIQCGMVGSTAGGLKFDRVFLFFKALKRQIMQVLHPRQILVTKVDNSRVPEDLLAGTQIFIVLYLLILLLSTLLLTAYDLDLLTSFSASAATMGNAGPGFEKVSSMGNFGGLPDGAKWILSMDMLLGRLEIFNILAFFFYRKY